MKLKKRLFAMFLAVVMVMSMCVTAFADNAAGTDGSITVRNATIGEKYNAYKVFDLTYNTVTSSTAPRKDNVAYSYTKKPGDTDAMYDALVNGFAASGDDPAVASPFTLTQVGSTDKYTVAVKDEFEGKDSDILAFIQKLYDEDLLTAVGADKTATSDTVVFDNLPYGYYVVETSLGEGVITIDSTLKDVTVIDKNEGPSWDNNPEDPDNPNPPDGKNNPGKVIILNKGTANESRATSSTANYGDTVDFSIAVNAKAYVGTDLATYYYITDTLGAGFDEFKDLTVKVIPTTTGADGEMVYDSKNPITLSSANSLAELEKNTYFIDKSNANHTFVITVPFGEQYGANAKIEVTYSATVLSTDAVVLGPEGNPNTANFTYDVDDEFDPDDDPEDPKDPSNPPYDPTDPGDPEDPEDPKYPDPNPKDPGDPENPDDPGDFDPENEVETKTFVYGIDVIKYTGDIENNPTLLEGAKFKLYIADFIETTSDGKTTRDYGEETDWAEVKFNEDEDPSASGLTSYDYDKNGTVGEFTTTDDGKIYLKGLKELPVAEDGKSGKTYLLVETKAPEGYNQLSAPIDVLINGDKSTEEVATGIKLVPQAVENKSGVELPSTGGMGTGMFYLFGAILLAGGAVLLNAKKRIGANR